MAVNHIRTLLLNANPVQLAAVSSIYVDPMFKPVIIPDTFTSLKRVLFPYGLTLSELVELVDDTCTILHCGELQPYTLRFDSRITYPIVPNWTLVDLCRTTEVPRTSVQLALERFRSFPAAGQVSTQLFTWDVYKDEMLWLQRTWSIHPEGLLGFGAVVLAYAYQLEQVRRRG